MENYSTTQATNVIALAGLISMVLAHFNLSIGNDELQAFLGALLTIGGIGMNWIHRYQKGDLNFGGTRV